ncbi:tetratricopeptide repeat protein [Geopsychrobacter electrodiphilus]|uniref:tetratricopeptide repeat protein n=1 Tax=Geopsychrobacter electrodiphilus TaxID=225196 RepID=UPI00035E64AC|nr:tetratricopeptide repeat protein [Geopsychrobacter electrodiphilus]
MYFRTLLIVLLIALLVGCAGNASKQIKAKPHYTLGLSFLQSENPTLALKEFLKAVEEDPKDAGSQAGLARAYQMKKAYALAEQHYLKALEYSDNDPNYQNNLAALYLSMERWDQAIAYFQKAADNLLFMHSELALMGKGYALYRKGDYPSALQAYRKAEALAPHLGTVHFYIGETYLAMGRLELARASYEKALLYLPNYSEARYQLAVLKLKQNHIDDANALLKIIVNQEPSSVWGGRAADLLKTLQH